MNSFISYIRKKSTPSRLLIVSGCLLLTLAISVAFLSIIGTPLTNLFGENLNVKLQKLALSSDYQVNSYTPNTNLVSIKHVPIYFDSDLITDAGELSPATSVRVLSEEGDAIQVALTGWRKARGFGRVIQQEFAINIKSAVVTKGMAKDKQRVKKHEKRIDNITGLKWQRVTISFWVKKGAFVTATEPIWQLTKRTYQSSCSRCHTQPEEDHFDANMWTAQYNGMLEFVSFDKDTESLVLKYLQNHASKISQTPDGTY